MTRADPVERPTSPRAAEPEFLGALRDFLSEGWLLQKQLVRPHRISLVQYLMLRSVSRSRATTPSKLAAELGISPPAIAVMLSGLERRGWITRTTQPQDRRSVQVSLTPKATRTLVAIDGNRKQVLTRIANSVPLAHRQELARTLRVLTDRLHAEHAAPDAAGRQAGRH